VVITDAPIKRGMLVLKPENISVIGGEVRFKASGEGRFLEREIEDLMLMA
jgi:hypothetical protein